MEQRACHPLTPPCKWCQCAQRATSSDGLRALNAGREARLVMPTGSTLAWLIHVHTALWGNGGGRGRWTMSKQSRWRWGTEGGRMVGAAEWALLPTECIYKLNEKPCLSLQLPCATAASHPGKQPFILLHRRAAARQTPVKGACYKWSTVEWT